MNRRRQFASPPLRRQRGVALVVVLILLLVMTLLGLASLRGTLMEERMSAYMYDRSLAFQATEAALREAEAVISAATEAGQFIGVDCTAIGAVCPSVPVTTWSTGGADWVAMQETDVLSDLAGGTPQYYIELMRRFAPSPTGAGGSASSNQYGGLGNPPDGAVYRVTARSHDPANDGRALVVLQATVKQR